MKQKWITLMALMLCAMLIVPAAAPAREVTPEYFEEMTEDAQQDYLEQTGMSYEEAAGWSTDGGGSLIDDGYVQCSVCGGWYMNGSEFRNHICSSWDDDYEEETDGGGSLIDDGYVQCSKCSGWYMNGSEFRNHICTGDRTNPSSSWTSNNDYYDYLLDGPDSDSVSAIGTLYVDTANGKGLNMRSRPNTNGKVLTVIPNGAAVTLFWYENSSWAYVAYRSYFGFCMTRHLSDGGYTPSSEATVAPGTDSSLNSMFNGFKYVNYEAAVTPSNPSGFVNLRWAPSKSAPVQCIYYANTVVKVIATNGVWSQVQNEMTGATGFMMNAYLNRYIYGL